MALERGSPVQKKIRKKRKEKRKEGLNSFYYRDSELQISEEKKKGETALNTNRPRANSLNTEEIGLELGKYMEPKSRKNVLIALHKPPGRQEVERERPEIKTSFLMGFRCLKNVLFLANKEK